jgi:UDP-2,3-diacylglucosamine hydrolase
MKIIIASDFHLMYRESRHDRYRRDRVLRFLASLRGNTDLLVLNGDIFDLWVEWEQVVIAGYLPLCEKLAELHDAGCRIVLIPGNHDFLFGEFLPQHCGVEIVGDAFSGEFDGKKLFVAHGDTFTTNDLRYQIYRRVVRSNLARTLIRSLHPEFVLRAGSAFSRTSRRVSIPPGVQERKEAGLVNKARRLAAKYDIVIFGHSHVPRCIPLGESLYFNSGDWVEHGSFVSIVDGIAQLNEFNP